MVSEPSDITAVDRAINRILAAERDGRAAVARCAQEAEAIVAAARARAERVRERTEGRVQWVGRIADRSLERLLQELAEEPLGPGEGEDAVQGPGAPEGGDDEALEAAIARLVDEMVGRLP